MTAADDAALSERRMIADGLRLWARSFDRADRAEAALTSAAVELVLRARGGDFADPGWPWIRECDSFDPSGLFRLDPDAMATWDSGRPEHPVMDFVEALAGGRPVRKLPELLRIVDRSTARLILTGFHYAATADAGLAVYAFGGDPWPLVADHSPAWRFWPPSRLDRYDRPAPVMRPRLKISGGAR